MKTNEIKRKLLVDNVIETFYKNVENSLQDQVKDGKKIKDIMNSLENKITSIVNSNEFVIEPIEFDNEKDFENYILEKSNELRKLLLDEIQQNI
jgi:hypothetical protein